MPHTFRVLVRYRATYLRNVIDEQLREAPWRVLVILTLLAVIWVALYLLLAAVFAQIRRWELLAVVADQTVFIYFFLVLAVMLAFSNAILSFGSLYGRDEPAHLLALPAQPGHVVCVKWLEGMVLSSWSFMLLGVPLMFAVAHTTPVRWYYYPLFVLHFIGFATIPATVGVWAAWAVAMFAPRRPAATAIWSASVVVLLAVGWMISIYQQADGAQDAWLRVVFEHIAMARQPLLPSTWTAKGIDAAISQRVDQSLFYLGVVACNGLFLAWLTINLLGRTWAEAFNRARHGRFRPVIRRGWLTLGLSWLLFFYLPRAWRQLLLKDVRALWRDPTQWTQMVIMFGLLAIYVINLPRLVDLDNPGLARLVSFLNLTVVSLILATFTSRFVYPRLSLESQQLWLIGLLPMERRQIIEAKFLFSLTITVISAVLVMSLAAAFLRLPQVWVMVHCVLTLAICCGLCGLSVGLGARFPVLGQRNPARIAAGFGGTFNLIASMLFVTAEMAGFATMNFTEIHASGALRSSISVGGWLIVMGLVVLAAVVTTVPMWIGARHFERLEA